MRTLICTIGLPASGKSTWAKEQLKKEPTRWKRINKDDLRAMLDNGVWSFENEKVVTSIQDSAVMSALRKGYDVILDNTHLSRRVVRSVHELAERVGDVTVVEKIFSTDVKTCIARDAVRVGSAHVGEDVIMKMYNKAQLKRGWPKEVSTYYPSKLLFELRVQNSKLPKAIICDLDGTLALLNGRDPYDATNCDRDTPSEAVLQVLLWAHARGVKLFFVSGREDKYEKPTRTFLDAYVTYEYIDEETQYEKEVLHEPPCMVPVKYELFMRKSGDMRSDTIIKREIFEEHIADKYNVLFVLDDRNKVVKMWRDELGLKVFQVAEGDF